MSGVGAGHTLGRYELLVPIAQGGMAVVWAARMKGTRGFQKIVAVKTMLPDLTEDPQFEEMFLAEAGLASRIKHPHVCEILDLGEQDGVIYIVMEWIDGEPLSQLARSARQKGGVPLLIGLRICLNAALGLHAAHELKNENGDLVGLVHRDVSPQNILVTYDGVVKIVDFGVAKASAEAANAATKDGQLKGKVPFMSPEQALGEPIDRRTDVFALGIVLFQLIAAKHPFRGDNDMITLRNICDKAPAPMLSAVVPSCPPVVNDLIAKALEKDPDKRFASMSEFARAIDRAIAELKLEGLPDEDIVGFVKTTLGDRAEKRRTAIREGLKQADERAEQRQQEKAQQAAILEQMRNAGPPSNMPPPLMSIPPPPGSQTSSLPPPPGTNPASTSSSSLTHKAVVADLAGTPASGGKKKFAVVAFAGIGLVAMAAAAVLALRPPPPAPAPAKQPDPLPTQTVAPVATPAPTPTQSVAPTPPPAAASASAAPSAAAPTKPGPAAPAPAPKTTTTTKPGTIPQVRDPGF